MGKGWRIDKKWKMEMDSIPDNEYPYVEKVKGCCQCESHVLPYYFRDSTKDLGYVDNKHGIIQLSIQAVEHTELTIVVELLNAYYINSFDEYIPNRAELYIHRPSRANYMPGQPSRDAFMTIITKDQFVTMALPLNLPVDIKRRPGQPATGDAGTTEQKFENKILINRISDVTFGDSNYEDRHVAAYNTEYILATRHITPALRPSREDCLAGHESCQVVASNLHMFGAGLPDSEGGSRSNYMIEEPWGDIQQQYLWWSIGDELGENSFLGLPFLPYISNCRGSDSQIPLSKIIEDNPGCENILYDNTVPVDEYFWNMRLNPESDRCDNLVLKCSYEEQIDIPLTEFRWYEQMVGVPLWYLSVEPIPARAYEPDFVINPDKSRTYETRWGRGQDIENIIGTYLALPVVITTSAYQLNIEGGLQDVIPREIVLTMEYYQKKKGYKEMVSSYIMFNESCHTITSKNERRAEYEALGIPQCILDINGQVAQSSYSLKIELITLVYLKLLNYFVFPLIVYNIYYILVGMLSMGVGAFVWLINRMLTRLRHPPPFHYVVLLYTIAQPALIGTMLGIMPTYIAILFCHAWFKPAFADPPGNVCLLNDQVTPPVKTPSILCFEGILLWDGSGDIDTIRKSRKGTCMLAIAMYIIFLSSKLLIPNWEEEDRSILKTFLMNDTTKKTTIAEEDNDDVPESDIWAPEIWRRANLIVVCLGMIFLLTVQMEFGYSPFFSDFVYLFILGFKVFYLLLEEIVIAPTLRESLFIGPQVIAYVLISNMTTMGAPNFVEFIVSYFAGLFLTFFERLYFSPVIGIFITNLPKWKMMAERRLRGNKRMTREEKAKEELDWRRVIEEIELHEEGIEPMLDSYIDYCLDTASVIIAPFLYYWLSLFYEESEIAALYEIKENQTNIYVTFAIAVIPFTFFTDVFIHNTLELVHGWKIYDYVSYQRYRFTVRENRWLMRTSIFDESIGQNAQTIDMLCFSSQYYLLVSQLGFGITLGVMALEIYLRQNFNVFRDPVTPLIFLIIIILGELFALVCWFLCDVKIKRLGWRGLWMTKNIEGTVDDDVAAKLAIGEGRQQDLEQERLELQALNSDRFRHRFLERNRPWILQHLVELLTPRQLDQKGPDDRPVIEYVRDVYSELMGIGEGLKKTGDRDDISSDEIEDELEDARRNWSRQPLQGTSLAIARLWLSKARKRRAFGNLIRGIIDQHKKNSCEICGRSEERNAVRLVAHLAIKGIPDIGALDGLISQFENQYGVNELDPQLWKAFFRSQAEYATRCTVCEDAVAQDRMNKQGRMPGQILPTRPGDVSSDEEDDDVTFDPIIVTRTSPEGRMMSKWLLGARKKLGGKFPRVEAKLQMDRYAQKLRTLKTKKARTKAMEMDAVTEEDETGVFLHWRKFYYQCCYKSLAIRWIRMARDSIESKFRNKSIALKDDIDNLLREMSPEEDWYFGAALRLEGGTLVQRGRDLEDDRRVMEAESSVKIHKIETDLKAYTKARMEEVDIERGAFEGKIAQTNDRVNLDIEVRTAELERLKASKSAEFMEVEKKAKIELGAAPSEMIQSHRNQLIDLDYLIESERTTAENVRDSNEKESRIMFETQIAVKIADINRRNTMAGENIARIRLEVSEKVRRAEIAWQSDASKWVSISRKKVQVKKREGQESNKSKRKKRGY